MLSVGLLFLIIIGVADYATGYELSFALFYLFPVSLIAWYGGRGAGLAAATVAAVVWHVANVLAGQTFSNPLIPYWNAATRLGFFAVTVLLLSRLRTALQDERAMSRTDPLTGVANARAFYDLVSAELARARRDEQCMTVSYIDLDNFKAVNDQFGHPAGDAVLRAIARGMSENLRRTDCVARLGGDEFALLLPNADEQAAQTVLRKIQAVLLDAMRAQGWPVSVSIGAVTFRDFYSTVDDMMRAVDALMYEAKQRGKDRIAHAVLPRAGPPAISA